MFKSFTDYWNDLVENNPALSNPNTRIAFTLDQLRAQLDQAFTEGQLLGQSQTTTSPQFDREVSDFFSTLSRDKK